MNTDENVKKEVVNEQKNLIAMSIEELDSFFKDIITEFDECLNYKVYPLFEHNTKFINVSIAKNSISASLMYLIVSCELDFVRLFYIDFDDGLIIFNYEILNWSD